MNTIDLQIQFEKETGLNFINNVCYNEYIKWIENKYIKLLNGVEEVDKDGKHLVFNDLLGIKNVTLIIDGEFVINGNCEFITNEKGDCVVKRKRSK